VYRLSETSSSAIAERLRCRVGQFWPKVEDDILQAVYRSMFLRGCVKLGYRDKSAPFIEDIFGDCDEQLSQGLTPTAFIYSSSTCLIVLLLAILSDRGDTIKHS